MANSAPHLATAVAGHRHLTPVGGRESSPAVNLGWGLVNLAGGAALLRFTVKRRRRSPRWDSGLLNFEAGYLGWAAWMAISEYLLKVNWDRR